MTVKVSIDTTRKENVLSIPSEALCVKAEAGGGDAAEQYEAAQDVQ